MIKKWFGYLTGMILVLLVFSSFLYSRTLNEALIESQKFNYRKSLNILMKLPEATDVDRHLAWAYLKTGNFKKAEEAFLSLGQNEYEILFALGLSYFLEGNYESSLNYFKKCNEQNKNCAAAEYFCGEIKNLQGLPDEATGYYRRALKHDYNLVEARLSLARLLDSLKVYDDAYREWTAVTNYDAQSGEAAKRKEELLAFISKKPEEIVPVKRVLKGSEIISISQAEKIPIMRIGILKNSREIKLWSEGGISISSGEAVLLEVKPEEIYTLNVSSWNFNSDKLILKPKLKDSTIIVRDIMYSGSYTWAGISDREYRGIFEAVHSSGSISLVNIVNLEEYLYSVLTSEMMTWWPEEALKVQAVIARNAALYKKDFAKPHRRDGFDLCDSQHCQVYRGVKQETNLSRKLINLTKGEVLEYNGKIVNALYSSNCSGHTQSSGELKGWHDEPYLQGVEDIYVSSTSAKSAAFPDALVKYDRWIKYPPDILCAPSKYTFYAESRWIRIITQQELSLRLNRNHDIGGIRKIIPVKRSASWHINQLMIEGTKGRLQIEKENYIRNLVPGSLRTTNFIVEGYGRKNGLPEYFIFWGGGWGHGVGLCQSGAAGMAVKGYSYRDILRKYYKGAEIKNIEY